MPDVVPRVVQPTPRPAPGLPPPPPDPFDRVRGALGAGPVAEDVIETLKAELKREYERGYHDGWASTKRPVRRSPEEDAMSRRKRRWRRAWRNLTAAVIVRKAATLVLALSLSALAAKLGLHLADASHDSKYDRPPANVK